VVYGIDIARNHHRVLIFFYFVFRFDAIMNISTIKGVFHLDKDKILKAVNKEKIATGTCGEFSNKLGVPPVALRGGLVAAAIFINPLLSVALYGAGFAYKHYKK